jgi:uncharacterized protein (DUF2252 family)
MEKISERIKKFNKKLLSKEVSFKYKLMAENPFEFFRGTCHLFYEDLSKYDDLPYSPINWISGDLHIENFGSYKGDNRLVYFDINDFDEGLLAPIAWELARVITSIFVAFDALKITDKQALEAAQLFLKKYAQILSDGKARYVEPRTATGIVRQFLETVADRKTKTLLKKRTKYKKGKLVLDKGDKKQLEINKNLKKQLIEHFEPWMKSNNQPPNHYQVLDVCFRLAGTGSVGARRYMFLIQKIKTPEKFMLIDMKAATPSSLQPYLKIHQTKWRSEADRTIFIQKIMQNISPAQLSKMEFNNESYVLKEMQPMEDKINFELLENSFSNVCRAIDAMGLLTASAQLRSVSRQGSCSTDELIAFGQDISWQKRIIDYSLKYSKEVNKYFKEYKKSFQKGEMKKD